MILKKSKKGFTIVELMVVCVVIGLIASLSIPYFTRTRLNSNEAAVQADLRAVVAALEIYRTSQSPPRYPANFEALKGESIPVLDGAIIAGMQHGYHFELEADGEGENYACVANPVRIGITGNRSFCVNPEAVIMEYDSEAEPSDGNCPNNINLKRAIPLPAQAVAAGNPHPRL